MQTFELENRVIAFSVMVIEVARSMPSSSEGKYLSDQLIRSGLSPALNYGEAISGESRKDFIHKIKIVLKELRETFNNLRIIKLANIIESDLLEIALKENNELISIFVQSIKTAKKNLKEGQF
jgi:four helix bundle protein